MLEGIKGGWKLRQFFCSEENCVKYLELKKWHGSAPTCHLCGAEAKQYDLGRYRCKARGCRTRFKVTTGTIFENSEIPLPIWYNAILDYVSTYTPTRRLIEEYEVGDDAAWSMHQRIMELFKIDKSQRQCIKGIYEFDEVHIGPDGSRMTDARKMKCGVKSGAVHCIKILTFYNRLTKEVFGIVIPKKASSGYIVECIKLYIHPESTAYSDSASYYAGLEGYFDFYKQFVHRDKEFSDFQGGHSNTVEGAFKDWRTMERVYGKMSPNHLQKYFDEYCWRYNCRTKGMNTVEMFDLAFKNITRRVTVTDIIKEGKEEMRRIFRPMKGKPATF